MNGDTTALKIGHAQVSTTGQDLTAQREALASLGVEYDRVCVDHGPTGTNRSRRACARRWPPTWRRT